MNLTSVQTAPRAAAAEAARTRPTSGRLDVTISDRGVALDPARPQGAGAAASAPEVSSAEISGAEARLLSAIAAPGATADVAPAADPAPAPAAAAAASSAPADVVSDLAQGRALGMYTGRGRSATMPTEGLAGQLIDVTG